MRFPPLHEAQFITRLNRFAAMVLLDGKEVMVHVANSGRMRELLQPGNSCYLTHFPGDTQPTRIFKDAAELDRELAVRWGEIGDAEAFRADEARARCWTTTSPASAARSTWR